MNPRVALALSLAVNLVLVLYIVRQATRDDAPATAEADGPVAETGSSPSPAPEVTPADTAPPVAPSDRPFNWERVESPDYREYIRNLRACGAACSAPIETGSGFSRCFRPMRPTSSRGCGRGRST